MQCKDSEWQDKEGLGGSGRESNASLKLESQATVLRGQNPDKYSRYWRNHHSTELLCLLPGLNPPRKLV